MIDFDKQHVEVSKVQNCFFFACS